MPRRLRAATTNAAPPRSRQMSPEANQPVPLSAEAAEPKAGQVAVPVWLIVLLFLHSLLGHGLFRPQQRLV